MKFHLGEISLRILLYNTETAVNIVYTFKVYS